MDNNSSNSSDSSNSSSTMSYKKTMNNRNFSTAEATKDVPRLQRAGEPSPLLNRVAARTLRHYRGVPSMTPANLQKTMTLLQLRPDRLVTQGLAPKKLLKGEVSAGAVVWEGESMDSSSDDSDVSDSDCSEAEEDEGRIDVSHSSSSSNGDDDDDGEGRKLDHDGGKRPHRPIHAALVGAGIKLRPRETRPLLRALGVGPRHLVNLGLVERRTLLSSRLNDGDSRGHGGPRGRRPHLSPPNAPPHGPHGPRGHRKPYGCGRHLPSGGAQGPPSRRPAHGECHRSRERRLEGEDKRGCNYASRHPTYGPLHHNRLHHGHCPPPSGEGHPGHGPGPEYMDTGESVGREVLLLRGAAPFPPVAANGRASAATACPCTVVTRRRLGGTFCKKLPSATTEHAKTPAAAKRRSDSESEGVPINACFVDPDRD